MYDKDRLYHSQFEKAYECPKETLQMTQLACFRYQKKSKNQKVEKKSHLIRGCILELQFVLRKRQEHIDDRHLDAISKPSLYNRAVNCTHAR